jgi:hypothetical protein
MLLAFEWFWELRKNGSVDVECSTHIDRTSGRMNWRKLLRSIPKVFLIVAYEVS